MPPLLESTLSWLGALDFGAAVPPMPLIVLNFVIEPQFNRCAAGCPFIRL